MPELREFSSPNSLLGTSLQSSERSPENSACRIINQSGDIDEDEQVNVEPKVYMACIAQGSRLGIAYFEADTHDMVVLETWEDGNDGYPSLQLLKFQCRPSVIYTSSKMEESFLDALRKHVPSAGPDYELKLVKSSIFSHEQAWQRVVHARIYGMRKDLSEKDRVHFINSTINLGSEMKVRAAGGLLTILEQDLLSSNMKVEDNNTDYLVIRNMLELSLNGVLSIDLETYDGLQIFQVDKHPSSMGIGKAKEGFSLFGMLDKCVTPMGRRLLRTWFLRPILDFGVLNDRLDTIELLKSFEELIVGLQRPLKYVKDVHQLMKKFFSPSSFCTSNDWLALIKTVSSILQIQQIFEALLQSGVKDEVRSLQLVDRILSLPTNDLLYVHDMIKGVVQPDQICGGSSDMTVAPGVCEELDELKTIYEGLPDFLAKVSAAEVVRIPGKGHQSGSIVYIPQVGYLMCFAGTNLAEGALQKLPDFELAFESGNMFGKEYFYHTSKTKELDDVLGDIYHKILDMERAILKDLQTRIEPYFGILSQAAGVSAELDCVLSLAASASEYKYTRPKLCHEDVLVIKNGRHALQELTLNTFIPNDTCIRNKGRINVITGPNYSGKSVYIKQVALIVFLSHIGSFVPADQAVVGLTDRIFSRLPNKQALHIPQSTFMGDLRQVSLMLRYATCRSLCLIDEFGNGTITADGAGLLCATLKHFASCYSPPKVLASTHFSEVFSETFLPKSENVVLHTMSILEPGTSIQSEVDEIVFLYRLVPGCQFQSYGLHCAELAGVPQEITRRAAEILMVLKEEKQIGRIETLELNTKDKIYKVFTDKLLMFDCDNGDLKSFFSSICT